MRKHFGWIRWVGALLSGLLVAGLFPPFDAVGLAWLALVPLLVALWSVPGPRRGWKGFGLGWVAGSASSGVQFYWLAEVATAGAVLLPLYLGIFWGLFGWFAATLGNPWRHPVPAAPPPHVPPGVRWRSLRTAACHGAVWAGLEWLRGWLFTGFGWNGLGVAFHDTRLMAQAADLLGVAGLSLLLVFFQAVLVEAGRRLWECTRAGRRRSGWDVIAAALVIGLVVAYGLVRTAAEDRRETVRLQALLVQLNIPQDAAQMSWDDLTIHQAYEDDTLAALEAISKDTAGQPLRPWPDWVVWPESAMRGRLLRAADGDWGSFQGNLDTIERLRSAGRFSLLFGVIELEAVASGDQLVQAPGGAMFNSLAALPPDDALQTFRKHHLVIFGETIPFLDTLPFLKKIYEQQSGTTYNGSFTPGDSFEPLTLAAAGQTIGVIPSVCFEDTVGRLTRNFTRPGPQVIVNVTNDGWFRQSAAAAQHFANARFRAIELRRPMLRCANTGVSAAINSSGSTAHPDTGKPQILADATGNVFTRGALLVELDVPLTPAVTLYGLIGDAGIILLAAAALFTAWLTRHPPAKRSEVPPSIVVDPAGK